MTRRSTCSPARRRGAVAVVVTLGLIPLIGILAFAFDCGLLLAAKKRSQTVADAAAHAAACQLYNNVATDPTGLDVSGKARAAALLNASANGFTNDGTTNTVTVNIPPLSGTFIGRPFYAEVLVTYTQARIFGAVLGSGSLKIGAYAVARGVTGSPTPYTTSSIVALDPAMSGGLTVSAGVNLSADSPVQVDSSSGTGFVVNSGVNVSAPSFQVVGGYSRALGSILTGSVATGAAPIADPLASLVAPDPATLTPRSNTATFGNVTLQPGVYSGGLNLGGGMNVTLQPGVYYIQGGNLNIANGVNLSGSGVTIYMSGAGQLNFGGGANINLTPPTSGQFAGLSVFVDRTSTTPINLGNGANISFGGTFYAAKAALNVLGGSNVHAGSQVVVDSFNVSSGVNMSFTTASDAKKGYVASKLGTPSIAIVQ